MDEVVSDELYRGLGESKHFGNAVRGITISKKNREEKKPENVWPKIREEPGERKIPKAKEGKKRGVKDVHPKTL